MIAFVILRLDKTFNIDSPSICHQFAINSPSICHQFDIDSTLIRHQFDIDSSSIRHLFNMDSIFVILFEPFDILCWSKKIFDSYMTKHRLECPALSPPPAASLATLMDSPGWPSTLR